MASIAKYKGLELFRQRRPAPQRLALKETNIFKKDSKSENEFVTFSRG